MQQLVPDEQHDRILINQLRFRDPLLWLLRGLKDLRAYPFISLFYGACFWLMAFVVSAVFKGNPEYTLSAISGCLLIGPFLAMGLYEVSMRIERAQTPNLASSLICWDSHVRSMSMLVMVMMVLELLWGRASLVVFAVFFNTGMPTTASVLEAVFHPENIEFVIAYVIVGGFFAGLVFSCMMVSISMILDRDTDAITACITSMRVFVENTAVSVWWGLLIIFLSVVAMLPAAVGLVVVGPWLGYASWHAYRAAVQVLPESSAH